MPFRTLLGTLFGMLTGVHGQEIRFCLPRLLYFGLFCGIGIIFDVFGCIFGSILITLTEGSRCLRDLCAGRYLCDSIANYGLQSHVMSSGDSAYMPYNSTTRPGILDMPLAQTPQFTIGCGVQWQGTVFQSRNMSFDHGTHVVHAKDILRSQSTIREGVSRKQILSSAHRIRSAFTGCFFRLKYMRFAPFLFWRSRPGMYKCV